MLWQCGCYTGDDGLKQAPRLQQPMWRSLLVASVVPQALATSEPRHPTRHNQKRNATMRVLHRPPSPGCVPGWTRPANVAPSLKGHWSAACGYEHTTFHECGSPEAAYDCGTNNSVWSTSPYTTLSDQKLHTTIEVVYGGQLGNNQFQYAFATRLALALARRTKAQVSVLGRAVAIDRTPRWSGMIDKGPARRANKCVNIAVVTDRDGITRQPVCEQLRQVLQHMPPPACVRVDGFFQDFEAVGAENRARLARAFAPTTAECGGGAQVPSDNEIVLHVRTCAYSEEVPYSWPACYGAMPWEYYSVILTQIIERAQTHGEPTPSLTIVSPPGCAKAGGNNVVHRLRQEFGAKLINTKSLGGTDDGRADYCYLMRARRIVLQPSTFGWWAAWLSEATEIHFPVIGLFAHRRTLNYPQGPSKAVRGGLKCQALFQPPGGSTKSLIVPEDRYVYHDVFGGRYFGRYDQSTDTFRDWGEHGGFKFRRETNDEVVAAAPTFVAVSTTQDKKATATGFSFCSAPPPRHFKESRASDIIPLGPRSMELLCFARKTEELFHARKLYDPTAHAVKERQCCNDKVRRGNGKAGGIRPPILKFPRSHVEAALYYVRHLSNLHRNYDLNFIGRVQSKDPRVVRARQWIVDFAQTYFSNHSHYVDTTAHKYTVYQKLGHWDQSMSVPRAFLPMEFMARQNEQQCSMAKCDPTYYRTLASSRFTLAPAGDKPWSQRFFESIMAGSVPIVLSESHTGRSIAEKRLGYKYFLASEFTARARAFRKVHGSDAPLPYCHDWAKHNLQIFLRHQTLVERIESLNHTSLALCRAEAFNLEA